MCRKLRELCLNGKYKGTVAPIGGKNLAILWYKEGTADLYILASSDPSSHKHSEPRVFGKLLELYPGDRIRNISLVCLYTEREPCGVGRGMADCYSYLVRMLAELDVRQARHGINTGATATPIYYTYDYPSDQSVREIMAYHRVAGISDEPGCLTIADFYQELALEERQAANVALKGQGR
jgi:hypothetical protein